MQRFTRRQFLGTGAAALAAPYFIPSTVLGKDGGTAPSNRIVMASIGVGWQGSGNMRNFLNEEDVQMVAICDLDKKHLEAAIKTVNDHYHNNDCKGYHDFRELLVRKDIDAVMIATPDHWHSIVDIAAANAGKDIYSEKPLSKTLAEGRAIVTAVEKNRRIWQTGSWQRSVFNFRQGVELVHNGYIGRVHSVEVGLPSGHADFAGTKNKTQVTPPPPELDYDFWIGPSQMVPYIEARSHKNWRWNYNTGGGQLMDWIGHHCDIAHWGLGNDHKIGPLEVSGKADFPAKDAVWNTATSFWIDCAYPDNVKLTIASRDHKEIRSGTRWIGENGWVWVDRGHFEASNPAWVKEINEREKKGDLKVRFAAPKNHFRNFLDCVKSRTETLTPSEVAHRSATPGHLGYIATLLGRKLRWDAATETIANDAEATALLGREFRSPWKL